MDTETKTKTSRAKAASANLTVSKLAENCEIMLSRIEAILNCPEALDALLAEDAFGDAYEQLLRDDAKALSEALEQYNGGAR